MIIYNKLLLYLLLNILFFRNFKKVFQDLVLSRRAIHNMNTLYPDATAQDLEAIENVCIICREDMTAAGN